MAWQTPKTDWSSADGVRDTDMNRIEGNALELKNTKAELNAFNALQQQVDALFTTVDALQQQVGALFTTVDALTQVLTATITAAGWSTGQTDGYYTNQVAVEGMLSSYNPFCDLVVTSATLAADERTAMGQIIEVDTFDGYVIARALEAPTIDLNVRFMGV